MSKRRKRGNINPKKRMKKIDNPYFLREKKINKKLSLFIKNLKTMDLKNENNYWIMFYLRLELKELLRQQEPYIWKKSLKRRMIYFEQLDTFKRVYSKWKNLTYPLFVEFFGKKNNNI